MDEAVGLAGLDALPDVLLFKLLSLTDFRTRMVAQLVCKRWKGLADKYPELLSDPCFELQRPDSIVDQDMLEDMATWLLRRGQHVTSLALAASPPALREEGKVASWREQQLFLTVTACLAACSPTLRCLTLRWHEALDLGHHFMLLRALTSLTAASDSGLTPTMLTGHTSLQELSLTAFTLSQGVPDDYLPPNLTRLHLDVDPDRLPAQLASLKQLVSLSLHRVDPHHFFRPELVESCAVLTRLTQLQSLELRHSHLMELPPGLSALTALTYLGLRDTHWRQGDLALVLAPMARLQALDLSYLDLPSLPAPVEVLGTLRALGVAGCQFALHDAPFCAGVEHLEVDVEWLGREGEDLGRFPRLRSLAVSRFGGPEGEAVLRRGLADLLAAAPRLARLALAVDPGGGGNGGARGNGSGAHLHHHHHAGGGGGLPLGHAARVVEFGRLRPHVEVALCMQGQQPSPAQALLS